MPLLDIEFAALNKGGTTDHVLSTASVDVQANPVLSARQPLVPANPLGFATLVTLTADFPVEVAVGPGPNPFIGGTLYVVRPGSPVVITATAGARISAVRAKETAQQQASVSAVLTQGGRFLNLVIPASALGRVSVSAGDLAGLVATILAAASQPAGATTPAPDTPSDSSGTLSLDLGQSNFQ